MNTNNIKEWDGAFLRAYIQCYANTYEAAFELGYQHECDNINICNYIGLGKGYLISEYWLGRDCRRNEIYEEGKTNA
jgi:hypothetical protein